MKTFILKQIIDIKTYGIRELFRKFYLFLKILRILILTIILSPILILILLISPLVLIRFGCHNVNRIGAAIQQELFLLKNKKIKSKKKVFDIWVVNKIVCNQQLLIMVKRKFRVIKEFYILYQIVSLLAKYIHFYKKHIIDLRTYYSYDVQGSHMTSYDANNLLDKKPQQLALTKKEILKGESILKKIGIPENAKIVCVSARDAVYLKKAHPKKNFSHHNYRDNNIQNYISSIKFLIKKNFYVIRMGKFVDKKIKIKNKKFIDYPFHPMKSDFMDIFLAYRCFFWIGNTGLDIMPMIFRKPILYANGSAFLSIIYYTNKTLLLSKIYSNSKNKKMSISKVFDSGTAAAYRSELYKKKHVKLLENSPKELKEATAEMLELMKNSWKRKKRDRKLIKKFNKLFFKKLKEYNLIHFNNKSKLNYSASFLKRNPWFLN